MLFFVIKTHLLVGDIMIDLSGSNENIVLDAEGFEVMLEAGKTLLITFSTAMKTIPPVSVPVTSEWLPLYLDSIYLYNTLP